jgi:hypothetical protein
MSDAALAMALRNIPSDLQAKLIAAAPADRASMLSAFLLQKVAPGGTKAKIAGTIDSALSIFAGATSFGDPMMNSHGNGRPLQELLGVDSRDPTYLGITKYIGVGTDIGAGLMTAGGAYTGTKAGMTCGGDVSVRPGQITADSGPLRARMGIPPANMLNPQAHHDLPQAERFEAFWDRAGLDIDYPAFGR